MGDCWSGFQKIELRSNSRIQRAACWTHARRKLDECRENHPRHMTVLLALIRQLYDLEDRAKLWSAELRLELRQREAVRVLKQIRAYLDSPPLERLLPKSDLAEAVGYLKNNWEALLLYTTDGRLPIDNNETEHLMKRISKGLNAGERWVVEGRQAWDEQLKYWEITSQQHRRIVTEAALYGSLLEHELYEDMNLISDDAKQFKVLGFLSRLCWVHAERHVARLLPISTKQRRAHEQVRDETLDRASLRKRITMVGG